MRPWVEGRGRYARENFSFDDTLDCNVSDPESESDSGSNSNAAAVVQEIGEAPAVTTDATERLSPSSSDTNDEPRLTQVSNQGDSQATEVGDAIDADGLTLQTRYRLLLNKESRQIPLF